MLGIGGGFCIRQISSIIIIVYPEKQILSKRSDREKREKYLEYTYLITYVCKKGIIVDEICDCNARKK